MEPKGANMDPKRAQMEPKGPNIDWKDAESGSKNIKKHAARKKVDSKNGPVGSGRRFLEPFWSNVSPQGSILEVILVPFSFKNVIKNLSRNRAAKNHAKNMKNKRKNNANNNEQSIYVSWKKCMQNM